MSRSALCKEIHHSAVLLGQGTPRVSALGPGRARSEEMRVRPGSQRQTLVGFRKRLRGGDVSDHGLYKDVSYAVRGRPEPRDSRDNCEVQVRQAWAR